MNRTIAIQSWCYRHFKPIAAFVEQLKATGISATELSSAHANFPDASTHADVIDQLRQPGIALIGTGVQSLTGNVEKDRVRFEFSKTAGIKYMSISFPPEVMWDGVKNIEKLADEYDMQLGIHNHGGYDWLGNPTMLKYIFSKTTKRIGLCLDTAWAIDAKQNAVEMAEWFGERLYGIHIKDFIYDRQRVPHDVVIGTGNLDLPKLIKVLDQINYTAPLVIEYEGDVENPVPVLRECVTALKKAMAG